MLRSFRVRLTLWNLLILAFSLTVFGIGLSVTNQQRMWADIDRDLDMRGHRAANMGRPGGPPGQPDGPPGVGMMRRGGGGPGPNRNPDGGGAGGQGRGEGGPEGSFRPPPDENQYDPLGFLRRPQIYDRAGNQVGPSPSDPEFDAAARKQALQGRPVYSTVSIDGERVRVLTLPRFSQEREIIGTAQVARDLRDYDLLWSAQMRTLFVLLPIALVAAGLGALFLTNRALKPVADVTRAAAEISAQDLDRRLEVEGKDELSELATTFNGMIERLDTSFKKLNRAYSELEELYENQRRFTADASHELRTPLTRLRLATSSALEGGADPKEALQVADRAADSMSKLVQQLLVLSRADAGSLGLQMTSLDLRLVASNAIQMSAMAGRVIETQFAAEPVTICGDEDHLQRAILNVIENAVRHSTEGQPIRVSVRQDSDAGIVSVADSGEGIQPEHLPHVTERFYRVDSARARAGGGSGLGLAICKSIVDAHGGCLEVESDWGQGTTVTIKLPNHCNKRAPTQTTSS